MAQILGLPEDDFGWRRAGHTEVTLMLDRNEAEAVLRALNEAGWTLDKANETNRQSHHSLPCTSLLASGTRVNIALSKWWNGRD